MLYPPPGRSMRLGNISGLRFNTPPSGMKRRRQPWTTIAALLAAKRMAPSTAVFSSSRAIPSCIRPTRTPTSDLPGAPRWCTSVRRGSSPGTNRPAAEIKTLWQNFLNELASSSDPLAPGDALKFKLDSLQSPAAACRGGRGIHRDDARASRPDQRPPTETVSSPAFFPGGCNGQGRNPDPSARNTLRSLIDTELKAHDGAAGRVDQGFRFPLLFPAKKPTRIAISSRLFEDYQIMVLKARSRKMRR